MLLVPSPPPPSLLPPVQCFTLEGSTRHNNPLPPLPPLIQELPLDLARGNTSRQAYDAHSANTCIPRDGCALMDYQIDMKYTLCWTASLVADSERKYLLNSSNMKLIALVRMPHIGNTRHNFPLVQNVQYGSFLLWRVLLNWEVIWPSEF